MLSSPTLLRILSLAFAASLLSAACASAHDTDSQSTTSAGTASCEERRSTAMNDVQAAIDANRQCATDADCTTIAFATNCFDACSRAVSTSGKQAIEASIQKANETVCATYKQDGCSFIVPPCVPPTAPVCKQSFCE
jgi:hypothetical protein